jgi:hypothetical protein
VGSAARKDRVYAHTHPTHLLDSGVLLEYGPEQDALAAAHVHEDVSSRAPAEIGRDGEVLAARLPKFAHGLVENLPRDTQEQPISLPTLFKKHRQHNSDTIDAPPCVILGVLQTNARFRPHSAG